MPRGFRLEAGVAMIGDVTATVEIVGREVELDTLRAFIHRVEELPAALVLEGDAGMGKSMLWSAAVEHARSQGVLVLASRPTEAEQSLAHAGLSDLLENVLAPLLPALPAPRRRALEVALLLEESSERVDRRALAVAVRDVVRLLAEQRPLLIAVDDVHWLDASSEAALAFAFRRLTEVHVRVLTTRRRAAGAEPQGLERALGVPVETLPVGPLSVGALHRVLRDRLGRPLARQALVRIHERSGGNPFFAVELARVVDVDGDPLAPPPVPDELDRLLRARTADLPQSTQEALAIAAALGSPSAVDLVRAGVRPEALEPAIARGVLERDADAIRFTHPLFASAIYRDLGDARRAVHARLADVVDDPLPRARHLALSLDRPDGAVASELAAAAAVAADRGAAASAAQLAEHALRLTPSEDHDERLRRTLVAARAHQSAGEWTRARALLNDLLAEVEHGVLRAETLVLLAELEPLERSQALLEAALREVASNAALQAVIRCRLAWATRFDEGLGHAAAAQDLAAALGDEALAGQARAVAHVIGWFRADAPAPADLGAWSDEFAAAVGGDQMVQEATLAVVNTLAPATRREAARVLPARAPFVVRARRASCGARSLGARLGRVLGRTLGGRRRPRGARSRHLDPVRPRATAGSSSDRARRPPSRRPGARASSFGTRPWTRGGAVRAPATAAPRDSRTGGAVGR